MMTNFNTLKQMFAAAPCRATPDFSPAAKPFILTIDFSKTAIGAVLSQEQDNVEKFRNPITIFRNRYAREV